MKEKAAKFKIGDRVKVFGPSNYQLNNKIGTIFGIFEKRSSKKYMVSIDQSLLSPKMPGHNWKSFLVSSSCLRKFYGSN